MGVTERRSREAPVSKEIAGRGKSAAGTAEPRLRSVSFSTRRLRTRTSRAAPFLGCTVQSGPSMANVPALTRLRFDTSR